MSRERGEQRPRSEIVVSETFQKMAIFVALHPYLIDKTQEYIKGQLPEEQRFMYSLQVNFAEALVMSDSKVRSQYDSADLVLLGLRGAVSQDELRIVIESSDRQVRETARYFLDHKPETPLSTFLSAISK